jgi:hypothetical protein
MKRMESIGMSARKRALLDRVRREQVVREATWTPTERLQRLEDLLAFAAQFGAHLGPSTDEPPELWLTLKARWRRLPE